MARFVKYAAPRDIPWAVDRTTLDGIEEAIRWAEAETPKKFYYWMNELCFYMALVNQGFARKLSFGPLDPQGRNSDQAWRLPVRRITGRYYIGWKVKQIRGGWMLYNDSREAYFIEFGINWLGAGRRVRRPIRKLSLKQTLDYMMATKAYHRVWASIFSDPRHNNISSGFYQVVQAPQGGHLRWEAASEHEARSAIRGTLWHGQKGEWVNRARLTEHGWQVRRPNVGGGRYTGPLRGRRLP